MICCGRYAIWPSWSGLAYWPASTLRVRGWPPNAAALTIPFSCETPNQRN